MNAITQSFGGPLPVPLIPESAPFTPEQRAWLNGFLAGLYGGAVADRYDRRTVALASSAVMWLTTVGIAAHAWAGIESVPLLYALVALHSGASGINQPTRGAIIPALVERGRVHEFRHEGYWKDVGTIDAYYQAHS